MRSFLRRCCGPGLALLIFLQQVPASRLLLLAGFLRPLLCALLFFLLALFLCLLLLGSPAASGSPGCAIWRERVRSKRQEQEKPNAPRGGAGLAIPTALPAKLSTVRYRDREPEN